MEARTQFTFYESFALSISRIRNEKDRCKAYDALVNYALYGVEPDIDALPDAAAIVFLSAKPNLDTSRRKAETGKQGGRGKATAKQEENESKLKANAKQTESKISFALVEESESKGEIESKKEKEKENENKSESYMLYANNYCAEPKTDSAPPVITLPLNTGEEYPIVEGKVAEWEALYPAVDVRQQLRSMRGWLLANPTKRKTKSGVERFISGWLAKEQNRGGNARAPVTTVRFADLKDGGGSGYDV